MNQLNRNNKETYVCNQNEIDDISWIQNEESVPREF